MSRQEREGKTNIDLASTSFECDNGRDRHDRESGVDVREVVQYMRAVAID